MLRRDEAELVAYLEENLDGVSLVIRDAWDVPVALNAPRRAADAVWSIPHPSEPSESLPNRCSADLENGLPVLRLNVEDYTDYAGEIASVLLASLDGDRVEGRLEPLLG